ncbi:MAG: hypothetical protein ABIU29_12215, partial [Chthoniobacterales bacterium]
HRFSGRLTGAVSDLGVYAPLLPAAWRSGKIAGGATFDWRGDGTVAAHSGTVQLFAHGLQLPVAPFRSPLDLTLEGSYSPRDIFFRTFSLANEHLSLGGFLMLGPNFIELQAFELTLDGTRRGSGTLFLPLSFERWRKTGSWLAAFDEEQRFDVDLALDHLDLAQLGGSLGEDSLGSGILNGKLAAFGLLRSLQVTTDWRLENVGAEASPNAIDLHGRLEGGRVEAQASAKFGLSGPLSGWASLPLRLEKKQLEAGNWLDPAASVFAGVTCPALYLETLPDEWGPGEMRGLVTGEISWKGQYPALAVSGEGDIVDATIHLPPPWPKVNALRAHARFTESAAILDSIRFEIDSIPIELRGELAFNPSGFGFTLFPLKTELELVSQPSAGARLSSVRLLGEGRGEEQPLLREALVRGTFWPTALSLTINSDSPETDAQGTSFVSSSLTKGSPLLLRVVRPEKASGFELGELKPTPRLP